MENQRREHASEALTAIAEARAAAADTLVTPWWYHPILGLLLGAHVVVFSLGTMLIQAVGLVLFLAGLALLVRAYRRLTGVWISGFDAGRASRWAYAIGGVTGLLLLASWIVVRTTSLVWPTWGLAALLCVGVVILGRRFDLALRAQLRAGA